MSISFDPSTTSAEWDQDRADRLFHAMGCVQLILSRDGTLYAQDASGNLVQCTGEHPVLGNSDFMIAQAAIAKAGS